MSSLFRRISARSAREEGFTLLELVVVTTLLMIVMTAILTSFEVVQKASVRESSRSEETDQVRLAMEQITKEIRQATDVRAGSSSSFLDIDTYLNGTATHVSYTASGTTLKRTANGVTLTLVDRLSTTSLFTYDPSVTDTSVITITLQASPQYFKTDSTLITLTSEIKLRNGGSA
jgi:type II secretory pathway pseudopilin PulG